MVSNPNAAITLSLCLCLATACGGGGGSAGLSNNPGGGNPGGGNPGGGPPTTLGEFRINQVGYLADDEKIGLLLSHDDLQGQTFQVRSTGGGNIALAALVGRDLGAYATFAHLYELDFSALNALGTYELAVGNRTSLSFRIDNNPYSDVIPKTLQFFSVQRCGNTDPHLHGPCHLTDGIANGGPRNGAHVDATGGWHDAGDYMKFMLTVGTACDFMLTAYHMHPGRFADANHDGIPDVLAEARIGLDWMLKMWDPANDVLYHQVADDSDHQQWRMPEEDDLARPNRPVFACEPGKGANVAGKAAAAWALGSLFFNEPFTPYYDPAQAAYYLTAARQVYEWGKLRPQAQTEAPFYAEVSWQDDLALAGAELYRVTGDVQYLVEARNYGLAAGNAWTMRYSDLNGLAHFEIAQQDPSYFQYAMSFLSSDCGLALSYSEREPFGGGIEFYYWGSGMVMLGAALEAVYYEELTGSAIYRRLATRQRDFMMGRNPWGVCLVSGAGTVWPHHQHHQVANLTHSELIGSWGEGPVTDQVFQQNITHLNGPDLFAAFQTASAVYHDDLADYTTNEVGIEPAAMGLAMTSWFVR